MPVQKARAIIALSKPPIHFKEQLSAEALLPVNQRCRVMHASAKSKGPLAEVKDDHAKPRLLKQV